MRELGCTVCGRTDHNVLRHDRAQVSSQVGSLVDPINEK